MPMIMDVGIDLGVETHFYLDKGLRVGAIKAHPQFVLDNRIKFQGYLVRAVSLSAGMTFIERFRPKTVTIPPAEHRAC